MVLPACFRTEPEIVAFSLSGKHRQTVEYLLVGTGSTVDQ